MFGCEKLRPYILGSHVIIHTDHAAIKYLMAKKDVKTKTYQMGIVAARV